jgi:CarD family transcriptional regulator
MASSLFPVAQEHCFPMPFDVGDKVVYPHHGAATIEKREKVEAFGKKQDYLILRLAYGDLTLKVPADNADEIGLRDVINDEEVEEVFAVLRKKEARMPTNWSRRFKNHVEKLKSGDIYQVAEVVRNLTIREKDKGLSAGEKRMLARARQILVSELTFALNVDEETAEDKLDEVLGKPPSTGRRSSIDFDDDGALTKAPPPITPSKPRKAKAPAAAAAAPAAKAPAKKAAPAKAAAKTPAKKAAAPAKATKAAKAK